MGDLFRRFWLPAMLSEELPAPDGPPVRLTLLAEELIAFRDSDGRVGVLDRYCPHRGASLFWGRTEACGLRCVYHGWTYDVTGQCIDMPNEPLASRFKDKIQTTAYPAQEAGGVIWVYMGPSEQTPPLPDLEWTRLSAEHVEASKRIQMCNYLQNLEGEVDSSHVSFLHSTLGPEAYRILNNVGDTQPRFFIETTDFGLAIAARRDAGPEEHYWRITPFLMPSYTIVPSRLGNSFLFTAAVPQDDTTTIGMSVLWNPEAPLERRGPLVATDANYYALQNKQNDYLIDREKQRTESFSGIDGIRVQDMAVQEDQWGPTTKRWKEHLGTSDLGIIATRRRLLRQLHDLEAGIEPREPHTPDAYYIRSAAITVDKSVPWQQIVQEHMILVEASAVS